MDIAAEHELALLSTAEMAAADRATIAAGTPGLTLMERAGQAVADAVMRHVSRGAAVLVLCGPGNNGGDGFAAARLLRRQGLAVTVAPSCSAMAHAGDAAIMARGWEGPITGLDSVVPGNFDLIVDALFGAGLNRSLDEAVTRAVDAVNDAGKPVIAVDVPSGLSGDSGRAAGAVVRATETVTFFRLKPGHLLQPGRTLCGIVRVADIGIVAEVAYGAGEAAPKTFRNEPGLWLGAWPDHAADTHKYRRGSLLVLAGGLAGVGAPRLSARAALRSGAGLVTIACRPDALAAHAARGPDALMQKPVADSDALKSLLDDARLSAALAGPALGLDLRARENVSAMLRAPVPLVLDADALSLLADRSLTSLRRDCERRQAPCILTPHEGEFMRVFGQDAAITAAGSKLERTRLAAARAGAIVVLKGPDSVIASPDGRAAINATGSAALATAGSGDVLGGLIAGLLAQGMPAFEAACAAVWIHGRAGEEQGLGLIADDLPEAFPVIMAALATSALQLERRRPAVG